MTQKAKKYLDIVAVHNNIKMPLYYKKIKNKINQIAFVLKSRQEVSIIEERQVSKISGKKIQVSKKYI